MNGNEGTYTSYNSKNVYFAWWLLKCLYVIVPIVAGLDKFFHFLVNWNIYVNPALVMTLGLAPFWISWAVGIIEIVAGILVFQWTKLGAYVVALWLVLIAINLISMGLYYDIAVRDIGLAIGAVALGLLTSDVYKK